MKKNEKCYTRRSPFIMKFPITRESLQSYDYEQEQKEEWIKMEVSILYAEICREFDTEFRNNMQERKFIWRDLQHRLSMAHRKKELGYSMDECIPQFIEKLKETFIGCNIYIDAFKIQIVIDWS